MKPLSGYTILDFTQYLAGPFASLRLSDLGATVIKVENPNGGDAYRTKEGPALTLDGSNGGFCFVNRDKHSVAIDLKNPSMRSDLERLIAQSNAMVINFRPVVTKRLGLDYETVKAINPSIVYGEITGYGQGHSWSDKPGQDLLVQCATGSCFLNGSGPEPIPFGVSVADEFSGMYLAQGVLAGLYKQAMTGEGCKVETSLAESMLDIQFEMFGAYLNDGCKPVPRGKVNGANIVLGAPYGLYQTQDGYLALAMTPILNLGRLLGCDALAQYTDPSDLFDKQDEIKQHLQDHLRPQTTDYWLSILESADIWCAPVYNWDELMETEGFVNLDMLQTISLGDGSQFETTRCPITIDGDYLKSESPVPQVGQHNVQYGILPN